MKKYILQSNKRYNNISLSLGGADIMKVRLDDFIKEADKFFEDKQDGIFTKGENYNFYGDAIEIKREYANEDIEKDIIYMFVYCRANSGMVVIPYKQLKDLVDNAKLDIKSMPKWQKKVNWKYC